MVKHMILTSTLPLPCFRSQIRALIISPVLDQKNTRNTLDQWKVFLCAIHPAFYESFQIFHASREKKVKQELRKMEKFPTMVDQNSDRRCLHAEPRSSLWWQVVPSRQEPCRQNESGCYFRATWDVTTWSICFVGLNSYIVVSCVSATIMGQTGHVTVG